MEERVRAGFREGARLLETFGASVSAETVRVGGMAAEVLRAGGKVLVFGNGGSAADAQHLAAELVNRFRIDRPPLAAVALTTDSSTLTAVANDFGFERVFAKQVEALARPGDLVLGITTSGASPNVRGALEAARERECRTVALTGEGGTPLAEVCDVLICVPSRETPRVQECHVAWLHAFCEVVDGVLFPEGVG